MLVVHEEKLLYHRLQETSELSNMIQMTAIHVLERNHSMDIIWRRMK